MWQEMLLKLAVSLVMKLLSETFVARGFIRLARALADKTSNTLDDGMVDDLAVALGQEDLKKKA